MYQLVVQTYHVGVRPVQSLFGRSTTKARLVRSKGSSPVIGMSPKQSRFDCLPDRRAIVGEMRGFRAKV